MKDEIFSKKILTLEEFGEMFEICIGDLSHALRHKDWQAAEKVRDFFERLLSEQLPKVATIGNPVAFEELLEKYKPRLQELERDNPAALSQWCADRGMPAVEKTLKTIHTAYEEKL